MTSTTSGVPEDRSDWTHNELPKILSNLPPYTGPPSVARHFPQDEEVTSEHPLAMTFGGTTAELAATSVPFIDATTPTNVTVIKGKTAMLACVVRNLGTAKVYFY